MIDASEKMGYCYFLMVVRSESMKPSLHVGDILVSYPINLDGYCSKRGNENGVDETLKKGDVVIMEVIIGCVYLNIGYSHTTYHIIIHISLPKYIYLKSL